MNKDVIDEKEEYNNTNKSNNWLSSNWLPLIKFKFIISHYDLKLMTNM